MAMPSVGRRTLPCTRIWSTIPLTVSTGMANPTPEKDPYSSTTLGGGDKGLGEWRAKAPGAHVQYIAVKVRNQLVSVYDKLAANNCCCSTCQVDDDLAGWVCVLTGASSSGQHTSLSLTCRQQSFFWCMLLAFISHKISSPYFLSGR